MRGKKHGDQQRQGHLQNVRSATWVPAVAGPQHHLQNVRSATWVPSVTGPWYPGPAGIIRGPGTLEDIYGGEAHKQQAGRGQPSSMLSGTCYGAKATVVPLPKLRV